MSDDSQNQDTASRESRMVDDETLRRLSQQDFASLGLNELAYVRSVEVDGDEGFAVYAADGTPLMVAAGEQAAWDAIQDHDMTPVHVH